MLEEAFVDMLQGAQTQVELVAVTGAESESRRPLATRLGPRLAEAIQEADGMGEVSRAVVVEVVEEPVRNGGLRRHCLERRMSVDHARGGVEAGIADAVQANATVVVLDLLDEKLDGVVG